MCQFYGGKIGKVMTRRVVVVVMSPFSLVMMLERLLSMVKCRQQSRAKNPPEMMPSVLLQGAHTHT